MATTRHEARDAEQRITGRRYCTQHQGLAEPEGGVEKPFGKKGATRWVCAACASRWRRWAR